MLGPVPSGDNNSGWHVFGVVCYCPKPRHVPSLSYLSYKGWILPWFFSQELNLTSIASLQKHHPEFTNAVQIHSYRERWLYFFTFCRRNVPDSSTDTVRVLLLLTFYLFRERGLVNWDLFLKFCYSCEHGLFSLSHACVREKEEVYLCLS